MASGEIEVEPTISPLAPLYQHFNRFARRTRSIVVSTALPSHRINLGEIAPILKRHAA
jgi:hypothetical protein